MNQQTVLHGTNNSPGKFSHYGKRPSEDQVRKMHGLYLCGMSLAKCGERHNLSRQWVWYYFKQFDLPTRKVKRKSQIEHNGLKYTINQGYWRCTSGDRHFLHYKIWKDNTGQDVPDDCELEHIDGDKNNFNFSNLRLVKGKGSISRLPKNRSKK